MRKARDIWNRYGYEIIVCCFVLFIIIYAIYRRASGKTGTWSKSYAAELAVVRKQNLPVISQYKNTTVNDIQGGESKGEIECRRVLQEIYNRPFRKIRPDFLKNHITNGNNLEIDCYNAELRLGVEYNGIQHYRYTPHFHKTKDAFYNQKYRDDMKRRLCHENGVVLIEVPYTVKIKDIRAYLLSSLKNQGKLR